MKRVTVAEIFKGGCSAGEEVEVRGWVRTRRDSKAGIAFINLFDGSCLATLQIVAGSGLAGLQGLTYGCSVRAAGVLQASPGAKQSVELVASELELIGGVEEPERYPIQPKRHSLEFLREVAHLRPRTQTFGAVSRVSAALAQAIHAYFHDRGFFWIPTPIITAADAEGAGAMFRVSTLDLVNLPRTPEGKIDHSQDFFGKETFLTVSGQLNVECHCCALSRVYTFGPTFRAENSNTARHLAEFWMIEPELAFADLNDDADLAEDFLKSVLGRVLAERSDDLAFLDQFNGGGGLERVEQFVRSSFERLDYGEAVKVLQRSGRDWAFPPEWGCDLQSEHEKYLAEEHCKKPVVVMNYPKDIKAFYMRLNDDGRTVAAMDVLAPGIGEIIGGSQREERLEVLDARMREMKLDPAGYGWYRDLRRYGSVPHAGFGLGFERTLIYLTGMANIRDVIPFPRTPGSIAY